MGKSISQQFTIGRIDAIDLPEFDLEEIACRIDTGAAVSALHCHRVKVSSIDGVETLKFKLLDPEHPLYEDIEYKTTSFRERKVKSSFGTVQYRYSIFTEVVIFEHKWPIEFTLADRENMNYPILLGRNILRKGFVVDVRRKNISLKLRKKP